jgi:hypothetical protein
MFSRWVVALFFLGFHLCSSQDEDFNVEAAKVRLSTMQEAILKSPMMTKSFLNRQAKFSSDKEESMGSLDNIMQREMARADTPISGSPVMSPGRLGSASTISSSPGMDASVVVEQALLELDGVLNETREMQLKASARLPRASAINLEPVIAIEETEDEEDEQARSPPPLQSQWSRQIQQPKMLVPELQVEEVARAQEEEVVPLPLASPKPSVAKRMSVKRPMAAVEVKKSGSKEPPKDPARLTMVATPTRSSEILDPEDIPVSPPLSPSSGRTKRLPPKILFEPTPKPVVVEVPKYVGPAPRAGSLAAAAEAEERSEKLLPDREALLRDLLQQGIITDAEFEQRMERIRPPRKISTGSEAPPVPEFPGVDAFGLQDDEFADPLSFDSIMSRNIALPQSPEPAAYGMSPPPKNAVFTSPVMPPISMPKNVVLKGTPPKPLSCIKCGTTMPPELKIEVRFCPSCGNKIR